VAKEKAGVGSAINDATRLFGATLGVAVIGSIAASLYGNRLSATIPHHLPSQAVVAAKGSVGGALVVARALGHVGLAAAGQHLAQSAVGAFLHAMSGAVLVAGIVAFGGAILAAALLPARPGQVGGSADDDFDQRTEVASLEPIPEDAWREAIELTELDTA
jgi:hypothetical protein